MASVPYGTVFDESHDDDEDGSSSSDNDPEEENDDVLNGNEHVLNDDDDDDELLLDEEEEDNINSPSSLPQPIISSAASIPAAVPLAVPSSTAVTIAAAPTTAESPPDSKRQRVDSAEKKTTPPPLQLDDSRRLFQRLWTDEDEIELLQGFLNYITLKTNNSNNPASASHHYDTALFYDQMKSKFQLDFNKNQLVEKLRRLKKKYRNVMSKISSGKEFSFKSPHDQFTFEISRKIWSDSVIKVEESVLDYDENNKACLMIDDTPKSTPGTTKKRSRNNKGVKTEEKRVLTDGFLITNSNNNDNGNGNAEGLSGGSGGGGGGSGGGNNVAAGVVEETVKSCLTPLFKELLGSLMGGGGYGGRGINVLAMNAMPLVFGGSLSFVGGGSSGELMDERWRKLQILELEVYSKRLELVQDQIKSALEELRSMNG